MCSKNDPKQSLEGRKFQKKLQTAVRVTKSTVKTESRKNKTRNQIRVLRFHRKKTRRDPAPIPNG